MLGTLHLKYKTHAVSVTNNQNGNIICFKHNLKMCDMEIFDHNSLENLGEYMLTPLPDGIWGFVED